MRIYSINAFCGYKNMAAVNNMQKSANVDFGQNEKSFEKEIKKYKDVVAICTKSLQDTNIDDYCVGRLYYDRAVALLGIGELSKNTKEKAKAYEQAANDFSEARWHIYDEEFGEEIERRLSFVDRRRNELPKV